MGFMQWTIGCLENQKKKKVYCVQLLIALYNDVYVYYWLEIKSTAVWVVAHCIKLLFVL